MGKVKTQKIVLDGFGSYLKMKKGCFLVRDSKGNEKIYSTIEKHLGEIVLAEGSIVTTTALVHCGHWCIDVVFTTRFGEPVAMLKNFLDDGYVKTRICQYESLKNGKDMKIAKQFVIGKIKGQNLVLRKYRLEPYRDVMLFIKGFRETNLNNLRRKLLRVEGKSSQHYFNEIYKLFHDKIRPSRKITYHAYEGFNNIFNLTYTFLKWKCARAILRAHLEPYLGYLHTYVMPDRPSLVCDFMELYRHLVDNFLIRNCSKLTLKDFYAKTVIVRGRKTKRMFLKDDIASSIVDKLHDYFTHKVMVPRIRRGRKQEIETLINEEALLLAKYLRDERKEWVPRIAIP